AGSQLEGSGPGDSPASTSARLSVGSVSGSDDCDRRLRVWILMMLYAINRAGKVVEHGCQIHPKRNRAPFPGRNGALSFRSPDGRRRPRWRPEAEGGQIKWTFSACGPFWPCAISN